jgi:predicted dehydrogenase
LSATNGNLRFHKIEEMTRAILRFPKEQLASFTTSFGVADTADFEIIGTKGRLLATQAYKYTMSVILELTAEGRKQRKISANHFNHHKKIAFQKRNEVMIHDWPH